MPAIVDYLGRPIQKETLTEELAAPSLGGVRQAWHASVANSLTPETLAQLLAQVDQNDGDAYLTLAMEMEERELHYASVLGTRKRAVTGLETMVEAVSDEAKDIKIADALRDEVVETDAYEAMLPAAMDAIGKGFSVTEIMWRRSGTQRYRPQGYKWRDQRSFQFDRDTGEQIRMKDEADLANGIELKPGHFIYHQPRIKMGLPLRGGLARLAAVAYMLKGYTIKDWWSFMEVFGMPIRVGRYHESATAEQKARLLSAVMGIGTDAAATIPESMQIEFIEATKAAGGDKLFIAAAEWLDKQISKGVIGQVASTEGTPGKLGNDETQNEVREDIKKDDAKQLSSTLRRDLVKAYVDVNFGPQEKYPILRIAIEEPEDLTLLSEALPPFIDRGLKVEASAIRDRFNIREPEDDAELLQPKGGASPVPIADNDNDNDNEPDVEAELQAERLGMVRELLAMLRNGQPLTGDQRSVLAMAMAGSHVYAQAQADGEDDEIDKLVDDALGDWRKYMDPILLPVLAFAKNASSYDEFLSGLEDVLAGVDTEELQRRLATETFKARGLGDGTDEL